MIAEYTALLARFAPQNPTHKQAEAMRAGGADIRNLVDWLEEKVLEVDRWEASLDL